MAVSLMRQLQIDFSKCINPVENFYIESQEHVTIDIKGYQPSPIAPNWEPPNDLIPPNYDNEQNEEEIVYEEENEEKQLLLNQQKYEQDDDNNHSPVKKENKSKSVFSCFF